MSELIALGVGVALFVFVGLPLATIILYPVYLACFTVGKAGQGVIHLTRRLK